MKIKLEYSHIENFYNDLPALKKIASENFVKQKNENFYFLFINECEIFGGISFVCFLNL